MGAVQLPQLSLVKHIITSPRVSFIFKVSFFVLLLEAAVRYEWVQAVVTTFLLVSGTLKDRQDGPKTTQPQTEHPKTT